MLAPVVLFVYNRPAYTRQTLLALAANNLAPESDLFIYADGPKATATLKDKENIQKVRDVIKEQQWCRSVTIITSENNKGLAASVINGVTETVNRFGKIIVVEDDVVTSPFFLQFMNEALDNYATTEKVLSIGSWNYYFDNRYSDTFFTHLPDTIAWATWKRAWDKFEPDANFLLQQLQQKKLLQKFNLHGKFDYENMLRHQIEGKVSSWGIRWTAVAILEDTLTLYPSPSLSKHIGFGADSTHVKSADYNADLLLANTPINITPLPILENKEAVDQWINFEKNIRPLKTSFKKQVAYLALNKIKHILRIVKNNKYGWLGNYKSWETAEKKCIGYNSTAILEKVLQTTIQVKNKKIVYERDSVAFEEIQYSYPLVTFLYQIAVENSDKLKVVDFGGSLGSSYFQNKIILDKLSAITWSVIEQENFVNAGKEFIEDKELKFYYNIDSCISAQGIPDVLLLSCVIQYLKNPYLLLKEMSDKKIKYIIIDNTPFNVKEADRITIQKVPPQIYAASYPCWFLNYEEVKKILVTNYDVVKEYKNELFIYLDNNKIYYQGILFKLKSNP